MVGSYETPQIINFLVFMIFSVISTSISIDFLFGNVEAAVDKKEGFLILLHSAAQYPFLIYLLKYESSLSNQVS